MRTQDEKTMAMLANGAALLNIITVIGGIIVAFVIYFMQKEKSAWVAYQALQSAIYQAIVVVVVGVLVVVSSILVTVGIGCLCLPISFILGLVGVGYSVYGAYVINQGNDFKIPVIGDWVAGMQPPSGPTSSGGPTPPAPMGPTTPAA